MMNQYYYFFMIDRSKIVIFERIMHNYNNLFIMYSFFPLILRKFIDIEDIDTSGSTSIVDDDDIDDGTADTGGSEDDYPEETGLRDGHGYYSLHEITFDAREDMLPVEEIFNESNLLSLYNDPFGVYAISHNASHGLCIDDYLDKPEFGATITEAELQVFCNQAFDALHLWNLIHQYIGLRSLD